MEDGAQFDVEAQRFLLETPVEDGVSDEYSDQPAAARNQARQTLVRMFLIMRSTVLFKSGIDRCSSSSTSITTLDEEILFINEEDSEVVADFEILSETTQDILGTHSPASDRHQHSIELQRVQKETVIQIVKEKNLMELQNIGVGGVAEALGTDLRNGLSVLDFPATSCQCDPSHLSQLLIVLALFLGSWNNPTVFLLFVAGVLSLVFGIEEVGTHVGWFNGAIVFIAMLVLVVCDTIRSFLKDRSRMKSVDSWRYSTGRQMKARVVRGGSPDLTVAATDLRVGDIVLLERGDIVPADGIGVFVDEYAHQALDIDEGSIISTTCVDGENPFLSYGSNIVNGEARMVVISLGMDTKWGELMSQAMESPDKKCKFESCLHRLNSCIHFMGLLLSILIIIVLFLHFKVGHQLDDENGFKPDLKEEPIRVKIILDAIKGMISGSKGATKVLTLLSVSLVGVREGVPLVLSVAISMWSHATLTDKASGRDYLACINMASVTTFCTDMSGEITGGKEIDKFYVGEGFVTEGTLIDSNVLEFLCDGIATLQFQTPPESDPSDYESKVQSLVSWAEVKLGMNKECVRREQCMIATSSRRCDLFKECNQVLIEKTEIEGRKKYHQYCIGPPKEVLSSCSQYYNIEGEMHQINDEKKEMLEKAIEDMLAEDAEVIAYAWRCLDVSSDEEPLMFDRELEANPLIFLGTISLKNSKVEEDTRRAISALKEYGIKIILVSGDDVGVLERIGHKYGLLTPGSEDDQVCEAKEFKAWTEKEREEKVDKIRIMGNCLLSDKILLIKCLNKRGEVVAFLGQRTIDGPALKQSDIGITIGRQSSEVATECSDISIWDGGLCFLVELIAKSRCFRENVRKFIQLQMIVAISSSLINLIGVVLLGDTPINAVELLWLYLVVALLGGFALLTGPALRRTIEWSERLITKAMWRNIAIQASYQTAIFATLQHKGHAIVGGGLVKAMIYNGFFLCQLFNKFIAREPQRRNFFRGLRKHFWFWLAVVLFIVCQGISGVAETVLGNGPGLNLKLWAVCLLTGVLCWVLDWTGKTISSIIWN